MEDAQFCIEISYPGKFPMGDKINKRVVNLLIESMTPMPDKFFDDLMKLVQKYCNDSQVQTRSPGHNSR